MKQKEIIAHIAKNHGMSQAYARTMFDEVIAELSIAINNGGVVIPGFGSFKKVKKASKAARNPRTGETIIIPEREVVKFKASKNL